MSHGPHPEARTEEAENDSVLSESVMQVLLDYLREYQKNGGVVKREINERDFDDYELEARNYLDFDELDALD